MASTTAKLRAFCEARRGCEESRDERGEPVITFRVQFYEYVRRADMSLTNCGDAAAAM